MEAMSQDIRDGIGEQGIIAVLEIEREEDAAPVARALVEGGVTAIELALRTPAAEPSISLIAEEVPEITALRLLRTRFSA
jgi:2-dehydro-3-deoxyphosphogluconate aldolase/(4S)-4-hydroxy-2-oxoglutarate aldolase